MTSPSVEDALATVVRRARIVWTVLLLGPLTFLALMAWLTSRGGYDAMMEKSGPLVGLAWGAAVLLPLIGLMVRRSLGQGDGERVDLRVQHWFRGEIIGWAVCDAAAFVAIILLVLTGATAAFLPPALVALALHVLLFPRGLRD